VSELGTGARVWAPGDGVSRVLVVTAHPDDVDFGAAGTVATLTDAGIEVSYCIVTNGDAGEADPGISRQDLPVLRQKEQREAAAQVGVSDVTFLGHADGHVKADHALRRDISRVIRRVRPQRVITQSPERVWDRIFASHPDHLAVGEAAVCAVYPDARSAFIHPELSDEEGLEPHVVPELWLMAGPESNLFVDTTAAFPRKVEALRSHRSQIADPAAIEDRLRSWGTSVARAAGLPEGSTAEGFRAVVTG